MKKMIPISLLAALLAILLPVLISALSGSVESYEPAGDPEEYATASQQYQDDNQSQEATAQLVVDTTADTLDASLTISVLLDGQSVEMTMLEYLKGVISAEMPVTFQSEALKAQAVAARTYTLYKKLVSPSTKHPNADVCGDYTCCKAYSSESVLRERWGADYDTNIAIITAAIADTDGQIITYENKPILAVFHSSSAGTTEASADLWNDVPYLQSVKTFEDEGTVPNYYTGVEMTYDEFKSAFSSAYPQADFSQDNPEDWIVDITRSDSGRITGLTVAGVKISGADFRSLFSLRSTAIDFEFGETGITLKTQGYGHGVGMSQYGANYLAAMGLDCAHILSWYYTGVTLTTFETLQ